MSENEAVALLAECVRANTVNPPGNEERMTAILARVLQGAGIEVAVTTLAPGRANLLARLPGTGNRPALVFSGHTDTVPPGESPWRFDPWSAQIEGDRLYGRGACDMKSGTAAMALAMIELKRAGARLHGDLLLAASAGEEADKLGARAFVAAGALQGAGGMVVGEPTGSRVLVAHKGAAWLVLTTRGRTAHGSMPEHGVNAVLRMHEVIARLQGLRLRHEQHPLLGGSTLSINTIQGGNKINVVPDICRIEADVRLVPGQTLEGTLAEVRGALADLDFPVEIEVINDCLPMQTDPQAPLVQAALRVAGTLHGAPQEPGGVAYYTDASVYQPALGMPVVLYGPGEAALAHQPDEWVSVSAYLQAIRFYRELATAVLA